ncbi:hypothetical protein D3C72_2516410 [compost metagenome]
MNRSGQHAILLALDGQRHGARLQHRTERTPQGVFKHPKRLPGIVVLVGRELLRQAPFFSKGHQFAAGLAEGDV